MSLSVTKTKRDQQEQREVDIAAKLPGPKLAKQRICDGSSNEGGGGQHHPRSPLTAMRYHAKVQGLLCPTRCACQRVAAERLMAGAAAVQGTVVISAARRFHSSRAHRCSAAVGSLSVAVAATVLGDEWCSWWCSW